MQLRKEEGVDGRGVRHRGRLDGEFRGEHERGHRTDTEVETQDCLPGGNIHVHRPADGIACLPRQCGPEPFVFRGNLSPEPGTDIAVRGRGAEAGHDQGTDYRLGPLQCSDRDIQAREDGLSGPHPAERGDGGTSAVPPAEGGGDRGSRSGGLNRRRNEIFMLFLQRYESYDNNSGRRSRRMPVPTI